ncbi:MAG: hypothetical protein K2U26_18130, partial [Cyclobacteriaceae bacterium]|nr:hypothetical protein [Cyclobacteriaceae bacterium]
SFLITMLLLLVPELATLINYFPEAVSKIHLVYSIVFCISMVLMAYAFLFRADLILDVFIQYLFAASFALILLVLFKVSVMFLAALNLVIGVYWYRKHFYTFEPTSENSSLE